MLMIFKKSKNKNMSMGNPQRHLIYLCDFFRAQNLCLGMRKRDADVVFLLVRTYSRLTIVLIVSFIDFVPVFHLLANFNAIGGF